jgi:hypothetical protein
MAYEEKIEKKEEIVPEDLIWDMFTFAKTLQQGGIYQGIFTPDLINAQMKSISYSPLNPSQTMLDNALADPIHNEDNLREFGQSFEMISQPYKRLISYIANLLSFDWTYAAEINDPKDYKTPSYQKDLERVYSFFDHFNPKKEFNVVIKQLLRNEAFFFAFNQDGNDYLLQEMPFQYSKVTGRWNRGLLYSFNMYYFMLAGVNIDMFHPFFRESFAKLFDSTKKEYRPDIELDKRGQSTWVYWQDVNPSTGWCFKLSPELASVIPYYSPLFGDLILQPLMRNLQKSKSIASAVRLLYGTIPLLNKEQKTTLKDAIALSPDLTARFLTLLKSSVSEAVRVGASPLEGVLPISYPSEKDIYGEWTKTALSESGVNTALIYTGDVKPNALESQLSLEVDQLLVQNIYNQFNDFMDYQLEKITKKYKFHVYFEGTAISLDRDRRFKSAMELAQMGAVLPQSLAASRGIPPQVFMRQLAEAKSLGFVDNLTPVVMASQMGANSGAGRPQKSDSELTDSGQQTRGDASNRNPQKGGKI